MSLSRNSYNQQKCIVVGAIFQTMRQVRMTFESDALNLTKVDPALILASPIVSGSIGGNPRAGMPGPQLGVKFIAMLFIHSDV